MCGSNSIHRFRNEKSGWALALGEKTSLYITRDGAITWKLAPPLPSVGYAINFIDEQYGLLIDAWGKIFVTLDGGQTFNPFLGDQLTVHGKNLEFINPLQGAVINQGALYLTLDGGKTWGVSYLGNRLVDLDVLPTGEIWALAVEYTAKGRGDEIYLWFSPDFGGRWLRINFGKDDPRVTPYIDFVNPEHGWLGTSDHLYSTLDGGYTWQMVR